MNFYVDDEQEQLGQMIELPESVRKAWGAEAAQDFVAWLEKQFQARPAQTPGIVAVAVTAFSARQKVNVLMLERVSNLLLAGEPACVQLPDGAHVWRVPIDLTLPGQGRVGRVGEIDIDAQSGELVYDDAWLHQIEAAAQQMVQQIQPSE
jgi:hypothetical protein